MRIAIISDLTNWRWAGCEELWAALAHTALRNGHTVALFLNRDRVLEEKLAPLIALGLEVHYPGAGSRVEEKLRRVSGKVANIAAGFVRSFTTLAQFAPDIVLFNGGDAIPSAAFLQKLDRANALRWPYVVVCHNSYLFEQPPSTQLREAAARYYSGARRVYFVANRTWKETEHLLATALPKVEIVRNPVNMADLSAVAPPKEGPIRMATIGRVAVNSKGQDILLGALGSPKFKTRNWQLSIYGEGPHLEYLKMLAAYYQISDRVTFAGYSNDVRSVWGSHHLLALPSRVESAPLVVVEAMLCERPGVVMDVGGVTEWITEPDTGFVSQGMHIDSFAAALERAWERAADWPSIGARARQKALSLIDADPGGSLLRKLVEVVDDRSRS